MSIDISKNKRLRSERTLICRGFCGALRGTGPRATGAGGCVFFVGRGPVPRDLSLILAILSILAILLQTIAIKVLTDLFSWLRRCSIDIKVFQTFAPFAASSCSSWTSCSSWPSCFRQMNACEGQALALQAPPASVVQEHRLLPDGAREIAIYSS